MEREDAKPASGTPQPSWPADVPDKPCVLIVDDDEAVVALVSTILKPVFPLRAVQSASEALRILEQQTFHVLLTDQMMPEMHGTRLIQAAKNIQPWIVGLIMTGYGSKDTAVEALKSGAYDFLEKPFGPEELVRTVRRAWNTLHAELSNRSLLRRLQAANAALEAEVAERRRAENALDLSRVGFHNIVERSMDGTVVLDSKGEVKFLNAAARVLLVNRGTAERDELLRSVADAAQPLEVEIARGDGRCGVGELSAVATQWEGEPAVLVSIHDITERKHAERALARLLEEQRKSQSQLIEAERMTAVGTMTAGVAHELNNPLMGILNFTQHCLDCTEEDDGRYAVLEDIEKATRRCIETVANLLTFARMDVQATESFQEVGCDDLVDRVLKLLAYRISKLRVEVIREVAIGLPRIPLRPHQMQWVFFHLLNQALDSVQEGTATVREITVRMLRQGGTLCVSIEDNGPGMAPEVLARILDPFFAATPTASAGKGMGLSTSRTIVEAHGGTLTVHSTPGEGTTLVVQLPVESSRAR